MVPNLFLAMPHLSIFKILMSHPSDTYLTVIIQKVNFVTWRKLKKPFQRTWHPWKKKIGKLSFHLKKMQKLILELPTSRKIKLPPGTLGNRWSKWTMVWCFQGNLFFSNETVVFFVFFSHIDIVHEFIDLYASKKNLKKQKSREKMTLFTLL